MKKHYSFVLWGLIFIIVNINIGPFDILPNFIGYILIAAGLSGLAGINTIFRMGVYPSLLLALLSFIGMFYPARLTKESLSPTNLWILGYGVIFLIVDLLVFYSICNGIYVEAEKDSNEELMKTSRFRWNLILLSTVINLFATPFILNTGETFTVYREVFSVLLLIFIISIIFLVRKAEKELGEII